MTPQSPYHVLKAAVRACLAAVLLAASAYAQDPAARIVYQVSGMEKARVQRNLAYTRWGGSAQKMDVYTPAGLGKDSLLPAVVFVHGGALPRDINPLPKDWGVYRSYGELAAASGLVGVTFNHRYYGWAKADFDTSFADVRAAIAYVRENSRALHVDPDRLCLWAFSGGGPHLSIALRDSLPYVRCLVCYYGVLDISSMAPLLLSPAMAETLAACSPSSYLTETNCHVPPVLVARAGLDNALLNAGIDRFVQKALAMNEAVQLVTHPQGRHGFDILDNDPRSREIIAETIAFIKTNLLGPVEPEAQEKKIAAKVRALILEGKVAQGRAVARELARDYAGMRILGPQLAESDLNKIGYSLLASNPEAAIELFQWIVDMNPTSPNAYDSLADGYKAAGKVDLAAENARTAIELAERSTILTETQKSRIRESAKLKLAGSTK